VNTEHRYSIDIDAYSYEAVQTVTKLAWYKCYLLTYISYLLYRRKQAQRGHRHRLLWSCLVAHPIQMSSMVMIISFCSIYVHLLAYLCTIQDEASRAVKLCRQSSSDTKVVISQHHRLPPAVVGSQRPPRAAAVRPVARTIVNTDTVRGPDRKTTVSTGTSASGKAKPHQPTAWK